MGNITFEDFIHLMTPKLLEGDSQENIVKIFKLFDDEKTGYLGPKGLRRAIQALGLELDDNDIHDMIKVADQDKDGFVSEQ